MPTLHLSLTDSEMESLRWLAEHYGLKSRLGSQAGMASVGELIKALARGERFKASSFFEWPGYGEVFSREEWWNWWQEHCPPPSSPEALSHWVVMRQQRFEEYMGHKMMWETASIGSELAEIEDLPYMLTVLSRWFRLRRAFRKR